VRIKIGAGINAHPQPRYYRLIQPHYRGITVMFLPILNRPKTDSTFMLFWVRDPWKWLWLLHIPKKHLYDTKTHRLSHQARKSDLILTCIGRMRKTKKKEKKNKQKSQNREISTQRGSAIFQPISSKFGEYVDLTAAVTPANFGIKIFNALLRPSGG